MKTEPAAVAPAKGSRFTALSVNLVVATLSMIVFLVLLEIAARGFYFVRWGGSLYPLQSTHYSLRLGWQLSPGQYREFAINESGFRRASETVRTPAAGSIRIFLVGGSTAFGADGLYPQFPSEPLGERTIDHYLETMLNDSLAAQVEVINAGVPEYRLFQETSLFREKLLSYAPDLLIFLDGHNDISFLTGNEIRELVAPLWSARHFKRGEQALNARSPIGALHYTDIYLGRTSYAYHLLAQLFQRVADRRGVQADHPWGRAPFRVDDEAALMGRWAGQMDSLSQEYTDQVRDLAAIARHREQRILYVLQPEIVNEEPADLTEMERRIQQFAFEHHRDRGTFAWRWLGRNLPVRLDSLRSPGFDLLDLGRIAAPGGVPLYTDYTHLTPDGNRVVARHMLPRVLALLAARDSVAEES